MTIRWPTLICCACVLMATSLALFVVACWLDPSLSVSNSRLVDRSFQAVGFFIAILLLSLSYFVYRARNWARRILVVLTVGCAILLAVTFVVGIWSTVSWSPHGLGAAIAITFPLVALPLFFTLVLCHQDVRSAFNSHHGRDV